MISAGLEQLIWQGKAIFKNYSYAFGQTGGIPIPENNLCIITGFKFFAALAKNSDEAARRMARNVHFLRIESDKNINDYVVRFPVLPLQEGGGFLGPSEYFNAYIMAFNSIQVRLALVPENERDIISATLGATPGEANEPSNPLGYAGDNVILRVNHPDINYKPLAERDETTPADRNQFNVNFNFNTLPDFAASQFNYQNLGYYIINFELVYINKAFLNELMSSK